VRRIALLLGAGLALAVPAEAQSREPRLELAVGVVVAGSMSARSSDATFSRPNGGPLVVFATDASLGPGLGAEVHVGRPISSRVAVEASGSWTKSSLRAKVASDIDSAADATLSEDLSRFSAEGAVLYRLGGSARTAFFVRGGLGWMRELAGGSAIAETGTIGNVGAAVKYWWGESSPVQRRRLGLRLDGRAILRSGGVDLGETGIRVAPAASLDLMFGF
jgi:hypothetical protein